MDEWIPLLLFHCEYLTDNIAFEWGQVVIDNFSGSFKQKDHSSDRPTLKLLAKQDTRQTTGF